MPEKADLLAALAKVRKQVTDRFPDQVARLEQFEAHLKTVEMLVEHLADEALKAEASKA